ncbi:MAG TPA: DUF6603 domain-containing protein [Candidatus Udaeobacter sp.]|nr:DUF6603 domain-containing protein [Candidatus Udaeobacter sp.]
MATQAGTLELLARELGQALSALEQRLAQGNAEEFIAGLGIRLPTIVAANGQFTGAISSTVSAAAALGPLVVDLKNAIDSENLPQIISVGTDLLNRIRQVLDGISQMGTSLDAAAASGGLSPADKAALQAFAAELPRRLFDFAFIEYLESKGEGVLPTLDVIGIIDDFDEPGDPANPLKPPFRQRAIHLDRLFDLFLKPDKYLADTFGWGQPGFDGMLLFPRIKRLFEPLELSAMLVTPPGQPPILELFFMRFSTDATTVPPSLTLRLRFPATRDFEQTFQLGEVWALTLGGAARFEAGLDVSIKPPFDVTLQPPTGTVSAELNGGFLGQRASGPLILLGQSGASRLEVQKLGLTLGFKASLDGTTVRGEPTATAEVTGGKAVIDLSKGDGFISKITGGLKLDTNVDFKAHWSPKSGLQLEGSGAVEIAIPTHVSLGPIDLQNIYIRAGFADGSLPVELSGAFSADIGPLNASVDRIGMAVTTSFPSGGGNLGPANLTFDFKPPNGVGLSIDAGLVKGGGYLYFDFDRGEYAGVLELSISEIVTVKAIGIITTKMPDGSTGFSLLIIITAEFGTGIQLGFGFTLIGLGGLLGLNRTMSLQPLMEGVRTGAINSIMFPQNPVENAPKIISDLRTIFPPYEGKFLIGPMAKLGWGTPTLVSVSLGVIIEIPGNIAILGVLKIALPADEAALIVLQVNFAGAIEFDKSRLYFFAALFESRVLYLTLEGEMGLLVAWGDDANFVVSAGGFHPRFNPPPLPFPAPKRMAISILNTDIARIRTETYFAVTSNTVQFGSNTEIMFDVDVARVDGHLGFDALFQFSPFHFIIEVSASVSLKVFGVGLFSISLHFALEGPTPWRAHGTGSISFFFFDVSADFDITWGESKDTTLPPIAVIPLLKGEFDKLDNWRAQLPPTNNLLVSLRKLDATESSEVLHPLGTLRVSQRAVPLDLKIDKVGNQKPSDANQFTLTATAGLVKADDADEQFAKAQFLNMSDADKLSQRAFDPMHGGLLLASGAQQLGSTKMGKRKVRYEEIILDSNYKRFRRRFRVFTQAFFSHFLVGGAISKSVLSQNYKKMLDPFDDKVAVKEGGFTVAQTQDNKAYSAASTYFASEAMANQFLQNQVAANPDLHDALHVIPHYEARL